MKNIHALKKFQKIRLYKNHYSNCLEQNSKLLQHGITMISLVTTILLLLLLSSVTMNIGIETYNQTKIRNFVSKMKVIQSKVDIIAEKNDETMYEKFTTLSSIKEQNKDEYEIFEELVISNEENWEEHYYYFTPKELEEQLGLKDQDLTVIINFENREVISKNGVKKDGIKYHSQYELIGGDTVLHN